MSIQIVPSASAVDVAARESVELARRLLAQITAAADTASVLPPGQDAEMLQALLASAEELSAKLCAVAGRIADDMELRIRHLSATAPTALSAAAY